jgi:hypothetical protein
LDELAFFLGYWPALWARYGETPIWLQVFEGEQWQPSRRIRSVLAQHFAGKLQRVTDLDSTGAVGIELRIGLDWDDLLKSVTDQVIELTGICRVGTEEEEP